MAKQYPTYNVFKRRIYDKLSNDERNRLFYWSLFDPSTWEESEQSIKPPDYLPSMSRRKQSMMRLLNRDAHIRQNFILKYGDQFFEKFANGEILTNYILTACVVEYLRRKHIRGFKPMNTGKQVFPDVHMYKKPNRHVYIEIKGLVGTAHLRDRIKNEVLVNLKRGKRKYSNFCLALIFPCVKAEAKRVYQLIKGYYVYEWLVGQNDRNKRRVLCCCITRQDGGDDFCLNKLTERIINLKHFQ